MSLKTYELVWLGGLGSVSAGFQDEVTMKKGPEARNYTPF